VSPTSRTYGSLIRRGQPDAGTDITMTAKRVTSRTARKPSRRAASPTVFISYRHDSPAFDIASKLYIALVPAAEFWGADVFMDEHDIEPADLFDRTILDALDRTTHFIVLLTNSYWSSSYCRKELARVVERFERDGSVRLLFIKVEELDPNHFTFTKDRTAGRIRSGHPIVDRIGDVQFLGPFDDRLQLVRLAWDRPAMLGDQVAQLISRLERVIKK
jgi:hypothetical protein